jgi:hypothetical protein
MLWIQPKVDLELDEGEKVLHLARRHWIVLVQRALIPFGVALAAGLLAAFLMLGGTFLVSGVALDGQFDIVNILFLLAIVFLVVLWMLGRGTKKQILYLGRDVPYLLAIVVLALLLLFRYNGGRILHIDPYGARSGEGFTLFLIITAIAATALFIYLFIDWANDFLILTNVRVVYDDQQLLVRHVQQQMLISDIQQVNLRQNTYPQYWLGYGSLVVRSFSPRSLVFDNAADPKTMQSKILAEVNKLRRQSEPELLRQMIEDQIYRDKPPPKPRLAIQVEEQHGPLPWLFHPNPDINYETETIVWRPAWPFLFLALLQPVGSFLLAMVALAVLTRLGILPLGAAFVIGLPVLLVCAFWAYWVYEEHENDIYILNRQTITDVDKRPFGPESRRVAPLGAIQDISFRLGFWEALLQNFFGIGFGDVIIKTGGAAGGDFTFRHVPNPRGVQATLNDYLTDFRKREKERTLQDALALLKQYHVLQQQHDELVSDERINAMIAEQISARIDQAQPVAGIDREQLRELLRNELSRMMRLGRLGRRRI